MPAPEQDTPLERLRKRLYAPPPVDTPKLDALPLRGVPSHGGWSHDDQMPVLPQKPPLAPSVVFLLTSVGFFVIAGIVAFALLLTGGRSVSTDNIEIIVEGPTTISGGDTLSLLVTVRNRNPVMVTRGSLSLVFPEGTYAAEDSGTPLTHYVEDIGDIPAGAEVKRTIRASVFGNEDQRISIPITFEYRTTQSSAVFERDDTYDFTIGTSPVDVSVSALSEIASGQQLSLSVSVRSNASTPLENVGVKADFPFGFALDSASPTPSGGDFFTFPRIDPGEEAKITITGTLLGEDSDERVFRFSVGTVETGNDNLSVIYTTKETSVTVTRPFLAVSLLLNREAAEPTVIQAGTPVQGLLSWTNTLPASILDGELSVRIQGTALDPESVSSSNGFYRSNDTTIVWSGETDQGLRTLSPGDEGNGAFTFSTKTGAGIASLRNPSIVLTISVKGRRVNESSVPETISSTLTRTIKVASDLTLAARGVYSVGPFKNTGPWPPKVNEETTYTIVLSAKNTVNSVAGARSTMTLPSYVRYTGQTSGSDGKLSYNEVTREVLWDIGDIGAGSGKEIAFQVALLPSLSQEGKSPVLVGAQKITGFDRFVGRDLVFTAPQITTRIETDPAFDFSFGNVTQ